MKLFTFDYVACLCSPIPWYVLYVNVVYCQHEKHLCTQPCLCLQFSSYSSFRSLTLEVTQTCFHIIPGYLQFYFFIFVNIFLLLVIYIYIYIAAETVSHTIVMKYLSMCAHSNSTCTVGHTLLFELENGLER